MARYDHLLIFQAAYKLNVEINVRVENFPRLHRYSLGERLKNISFELMDAIIKANSLKDKKEALEEVEIVLEKIKLTIRLCFDLKILGHKGFEYIARSLDDIGRQLFKWKEWSLK